MVLPRPEGGFFTTEAPDRTYKTERGARQAERMFQNPQMWQGWTRQETQQQQQQDAVLDTTTDETEDPFIGWYKLPQAIKDEIHNSPSSYHCIEKLLSNGWTGVHLSSIVEDFGQNFVDLYL